jgi:general L-amino acid transport system permease protein
VATSAPERSGEPVAAREPPPPRRGVIAWLRANLFASAPSAVATGIMLVGLAWFLPRAVRWLFVDAVWTANYEACRALDYRAACWGFVAEKHRLILFGRYPWSEQWRPLVATILFLGAIAVTAHPRAWRRGVLAIWVPVVAAFFLLLRGGVLGLTPVEPGAWGGLPLTIALTALVVAGSIPLGVVLALARRSRMPLVRGLATLYIELVRGVPLITVLFVASFLFPLLLPQGLRLDALARVALGMTFFQAAYMAEVVRGGLQALPRGQGEAAEAIGLPWWKVQRRVILPQALVLVIPSFVNSVLSTFLDTSLVTVVSIYDLTGALRLALGDPQWRNFFLEGYLFVGVVYFTCSLTLSRYSHWLERHLGRWARV